MAEWIGIGGLLIALARLFLKWAWSKRAEALQLREQRRGAYEDYLATMNSAWVAIQNYLPLTRVNLFTAPARLFLLQRSGIWDALKEGGAAVVRVRSRVQAVGSSDAIVAADGVLEVLHRAAIAARERSSSHDWEEEALVEFKAAREKFERVMERDLSPKLRWLGLRGKHHGAFLFEPIRPSPIEVLG